jgi:hypothetical protein
MKRLVPILAVVLASLARGDAQAVAPQPLGPSYDMVVVGDSITQGTGASIQGLYQPAPFGMTTSVYPANATDWISLLRQSSLCAKGGTIWRMGQGSQKIANALSQYTHSQGTQSTVNFKTNSPFATFTSVSQLVQSGTVATAYGSDIPPNTVATFGTVQATCSFLSPTSQNTLTMVGSTAALRTGMFIVNIGPGADAVGTINISPGTTISSIAGQVITLSTPAFSFGDNGGTYTSTFLFVSPHIRLSNAFVGATGSETMILGGTLVSSSGTFVNGSTTVTGVTTTGMSVGLASNMGIGSMYTVPGTTFSILGSTITLSAPATASSNGPGSFYASTPTFNTVTTQNTYFEGINTTPHLLSPAVTGMAGTLVLFYGVNDAGNGGDLATWESNMLAYRTLAVADGYTVIWMTQVPLLTTASFGYGANTALQDSMNSYVRAEASSLGDACFDVASQFPGHIAADILHYTDGIHPSDLGYQLIADYVGAEYVRLLGASAYTYAVWANAIGLTDASADQSAVLQPDGMTNLFKYALGLDPTVSYNPGAPELPAVQIKNMSGSDYLTLTFTGMMTDVTYTVQASDGTSGPWMPVATYGGFPPPGTVTVQDTQPISASPTRYMRLQVSSP